MANLEENILYIKCFFFPHHLDLTTTATLEKINKKRSKALMSYTQNIDYR